MRSRHLVLGAALGATLVGAPAHPVSGQAQASSRLVTVVGDLHLGLGQDESGAWHPSEDFRWAEELELFLTALHDAGAGANDLILNGDTFELWESEVADCRPDDVTLGCTEEEAISRLERVLAAHPREVAALRGFATAGTNRLVVIPGDHDAALLFPSVGARVVDALGGTAGRVELADAGFWASADGQIHVEHGHQLRWRANRYADWPRPFVDRDGRRYLERPWGQTTVEPYFEARERRYPVIDNFADRGAGLVYGLSADGVTVAAGDAAALLRYLLFRMPWSQFRVDLDAGDVRPPTWDLAAVRTEGPAFLSAALADDHRFKPVAEAALERGALSELMTGLGDAELTAICDYRAAARRSRRRFERILTQFDPQGPPVAECPRAADSRGGAFDYFWRSRDEVYHEALDRAARGRVDGQRPIAVFVHGHTHLVDWRQRVLEMTSLGETVIVDGFSPVRGALTPVVVNGGAWQRTVTPVQFDRLRREHAVTEAELLVALQPERLAPCYSFVQVAPYADTPGLPAIRFWREGAAGWEMADSCGSLATLDR